jgi:hypothetical protein
MGGESDYLNDGLANFSVKTPRTRRESAEFAMDLFIDKNILDFRSAFAPDVIRSSLPTKCSAGATPNVVVDTTPRHITSD